MKNLLSAESGGKTEVSPEAVAYDVASNFFAEDARTRTTVSARSAEIPA
ncbi:MAG: hypothetical protein L6V85_01630 [Clostridiales bacterium]|nr:MAG: hypothetical protein L6V85_01630 [Clostridiales bacterium]